MRLKLKKKKSPKMSKDYWNCYADMIDYSVYLFLFHRLIFDKYFSLIIIQCFVWSVLSGVSVCYFSMFSFGTGAYKGVYSDGTEDHAFLFV